MTFSEEVIEDAWMRSRGYCECQRTNHASHRNEKCSQSLVWGHRGKEKFLSCWEPHKIDAAGPDTLSNCEILCSKCLLEEKEKDKLENKQQSNQEAVFSSYAEKNLKQ